MKTIICLTFICCTFYSKAQEVPIIKIKQLEKILASADSKILVVNFWATWCAPCVKELPMFEALNARNSPETKVVLINLDFADKVDKVKTFLARKNMKTPVVLLDEIDYNSWIEKVDPSWQGAIPATVIINTQTGQRKFLAKELVEGELDQVIQELSKS